MGYNDRTSSDSYYTSLDLQFDYQETWSPTPGESQVETEVGKTSEPDLYRVAQMMDEWIAQENVAYGKILSDKNDIIADLQYKLANALSSANRMANIVVEQDVQLDQLLPGRMAFWSIGTDAYGTPIPILNTRLIDLTAEEELTSDEEEDLMDYLIHL